MDCVCVQLHMELIIDIWNIKTCWFMQLLSVLRCMKMIVLKTEVTFYMLVDSQKSCCVHTLLPLPSKTKLTHFLTHYQSISSSASLSVSQVSVASYSGGGREDCSSALRTPCTCSSWTLDSSGERQDYTPRPLISHLPWPTADRAAVTGSPEGHAVSSWTLREKPNCWLLWPLALKWSLFLWLSSAINSSMPFSCPIENKLSRARLWGWHWHSERKPSTTHSDISRD